MPTKLLHVLSFLGKAAGLALTIAGPLSGILSLYTFRYSLTVVIRAETGSYL